MATAAANAPVLDPLTGRPVATPEPPPPIGGKKSRRRRQRSKRGRKSRRYRGGSGCLTC
jgi:hypothetical protein